MSTISQSKVRVPARETKRARVRGTSAHLIGALRGKIRVTGSIMSTGRKWNGQS